MDRAKQFFISESIRFFQPVYEEQYGLKCVNESGYDPDAPCLFFGMYRDEDTARIHAHRGKSILLWAGIDAANLDVIRGIANDLPGTRHIAMTHYHANHLRQFGLDFKLITMPNTVLDFWQPEPKGNCVYCYAPNDVYGRSLAQEIAKHINYEVILTESATQMTKAELKELYKRSFVGMRLRGFDGASATVSEMALMGRYTVWTGGTPTALPWSTPEDIVAHINRQATTIGQTDTGTAIFMRKYLDTGTAWLNC